VQNQVTIWGKKCGIFIVTDFAVSVFSDVCEVGYLQWSTDYTVSQKKQDTKLLEQKTSLTIIQFLKNFH